MPSIETYRKQAKQLVRWHRERNYSIGEKLRLIERYRHITDAEALSSPFPLTLAQEIIAVEAGFKSWAELKASSSNIPRPAPSIEKELTILGVVPILFVSNVEATAAFYADKLGFSVDFLHGNPPFYGSVSRDRACLHLRFVHRTNFEELAAREGSLILASVEVSNVKALFEEYKARGVEFAQQLVREAWGGINFFVRDPDGNVISFVQYRTPMAPSADFST
jgi:catechol 2,3-dioxygenase-like lactoylglutathione lyase family enzyme